MIDRITEVGRTSGSSGGPDAGFPDAGPAQDVNANARQRDLRPLFSSTVTANPRSQRINRRSFPKTGVVRNMLA